MAKERILAKQLAADELGQVEDEWCDSSTVMSLLGHIKYLSDIIIAQRALGIEEKKSGANIDTG